MSMDFHWDNVPDELAELLWEMMNTRGGLVNRAEKVVEWLESNLAPCAFSYREGACAGIPAPGYDRCPTHQIKEKT
jgi:hypothetical protein